MTTNHTVGGEYYISGKLNIGVNLNSGRRHVGNNRKVRIVEIYGTMCSITLVNAYGKDEGHVIHAVPLHELKSEPINTSFRKVSSYKPHLLSYLASPYSSGGLNFIAANYQATEVLVAHLLATQHHIYSPIVHNHAISQNPDYPTYEMVTALQWKAYNETFLRRSEQLLVFTLGNWQESRGVQHEIEFYVKLRQKLTVFKVDETLNITPFFAEVRNES
jgi:hypothetical protein